MKVLSFIKDIKRKINAYLEGKVKIIDWYIIRKFLGAFFFSILLIIAIAVVFDTAEKMDDFIEKHAPLKAIVFDYYFNFIPYFTILYSHLFTFISVAFFTSKLAYRTEIIAILSSGISYRRMLVPYFISATIIAVMSYFLLNYVVPDANKVRIDFEYTYVYNKKSSHGYRNLHKQVRPGVFIFIQSYSSYSNSGYMFSIEKYDINNNLKSKLMADYINYDTAKKKWTVRDYYIRDIDGMNEKITKGSMIDTTFNLTPDDFERPDNFVETMNINELNAYINQQRVLGGETIELYLIEKYKRIAIPFSTYIMTLIAVCVSSRKVRGGTGLHIGIGLGFCFTYIIFMQFSQQFAISGGLNPLLAVWIPNIVYALLGYYLYRIVPK